MICRCSEAKEPLADTPGTNRPARLWRVRQRNCNHSAFNGYRRTTSDYSDVQCLRCGAIWRTKAGYVDDLKDLAADEHYISSGYKGHVGAMLARGREPHETHAGD